MTARPWLLVILAVPGAAMAGPNPTEAAIKPELAALSKIVGDWDCKGVFVKSGKPIASTLRFAVALEGSWVMGQQDDRPPNQFHATMMWGHDAATRQLRGAVFDNFGGMRAFASPGWDGAKLTWTRSDVTATAATERFIYELAPSGGLAVTWQTRKAGPGEAWATGDTLTCTRT
jgi:hypothetical protein